MYRNETIKRKNRRWKFLCLLLAGVCILGGCAEKRSQNFVSKVKDDTENSVTAEDVSSDVTLDLTNYKLDDETAYNANMPYLAVTEDGIYFWGSLTVVDEDHPSGIVVSAVKYYDFASGSVVPVCNRADCAHDEFDCNAIPLTDADSGVEYDNQDIFYYEGFLYFLGEDTKEGKLNLYRLAGDGSTCESYMTLFETAVVSEEGESEERTLPKICLKDGYVYYINLNEEHPALRRMELGGDTAEVLFENNGERGTITNMSANGDFLFFLSYNTSEDSSETEGGIYCYNCVSGEILQLVDTLSDCHVQNQTLYYSVNSEIHARSLSDGSETMISAGGEWGLWQTWFLSGEVVYLYDYETFEMSAYDFDGTLLAEQTEDLGVVAWSYDSYVLVNAWDEAGNTVKKIMNMDDFAAGAGEWVTLEVSDSY